MILKTVCLHFCCNFKLTHTSYIGHNTANIYREVTEDIHNNYRYYLNVKELCLYQ